MHTVTLDDLYIDQYEVTNARYAECVDAGMCDSPGGSDYAISLYADHPVVYVSWHDATAYCEWRGARLPTEAEWEKAARGGLEGMNYPWGDEFDGQQANFCDSNCGYDWKETDFDDGYTQNAPTGSYAPNGFGLYDMAGNVWEWVSSQYRGYPYDATDGREELESDSSRVLRGGSWYHVGNYLRVADRFDVDPSFRYHFIGFRCARSP